MTEEERRDLLCRTGAALYGSVWQSTLAHYLKVEVRTVQRWVAADRTPPITVLRQLVEHCDERIAEIERMRDTLARSLE